MRFLNLNNTDNIISNSKNSIDDTDVSDFNYKRYKFYKELNKFFTKNPNSFEQLISKYNSVKNRKMQEKVIYRSIISKLKGDDTSNNAKSNIYEEIKKNLKNKNQDGKSEMKGGDLKDYFETKDENLLNEFNKKNNEKFIKTIKKKYQLNETLEKEDKNFQEEDNPMQKFINEYYKANKDYKKNIKGKKDEVQEEKNLKQRLIKAVDEFDNNPMNPLDILSIKNDDRIVFIVITFIIRYVTLLLVNWCVEIDIIKSFNQAFILFTFIYIIIFWLIVMIINVNISPDDSSESSIIGKVQSVLYYFHFRINDIGRLLVHTLLILLLLLIPIIVKSENKINDDPLTYDERIKLYNTLSLFTIFMWIFTSIIASKY